MGTRCMEYMCMHANTDKWGVGRKPAAVAHTYTPVPRLRSWIRSLVLTGQSA